MARPEDIKAWAARRRAGSAGSALADLGIPQSGAGGGPAAGPGNDSPTGDDTIPGDGEDGAEPHHSLDECAEHLRQTATALREMDEIEGVDLDDLAQKAEDLAGELEDASQKAEEAEPEEGEPDGDETVADDNDAGP